MKNFKRIFEVLLYIVLFNTTIQYSYSETKTILKKDSVKTFRLGDINVGGDYINQKITEKNIIRIPMKIINSLDAPTMNQLRFVMPSASVRTNSRGEATMTLRGASERQFALFFDGMPLSIPWDGRGDLNFIPTDVIGGININNSTTSMLYGANILGGIAEIRTYERFNQGYGNQFKIQANQNGEVWTSNNFDFKTGDFNSLLNVSYLTSPGISLPSNTDNLNYQSDKDNERDLRTNTNQNRVNIFGRTEYEIDESSKMSLSVNYTQDAKGVQAESYQPISNVRLWEYPNRNRLFSIFNLEKSFGVDNDFNLKTTLWFDNYNQEILTFKDIDFDQDSNRTGSQLDNDQTFGARVIGNYKISSSDVVNISFNTLYSKHNEIAVNLTNLQDLNTNYNLDFSQLTSSFGFDYSHLFSTDFTAKIGAAYDIHTTPLAGNFPELNNQSMNDYAMFLNLNYQLTDELNLNWATNRRTRFPSMREALSGALNRFVANPNLAPETGVLNDLSATYQTHNLKTKLTGFYNLYDNMIIQVRLNRDEDQNRRRVRVNLQNSTVSGFELSNEYKTNDFTFILNFSYINTDISNNDSTTLFINGNKVVRTNETKIDTLENRPTLFSGLVVNYKLTQDLDTQLEMDYVGQSFQPDADGIYREIKGNAIFNLRFNHNFIIQDENLLSIFVRMNNIFDTFRESQLGIIEPGRTFTFGLNYRI